MKYFTNINSLDELKKEYRRLVLKHHPDCGGDTETMKQINIEYGSIIRFGHWNGDDSKREYNGQEYDWIFIDEATQFSEEAFRFLGGCLRGVNEFPKRMYLTCNPGGVGHRWVKRLFIDRDYKTNCENPEENENPDDYTMIFATVRCPRCRFTKNTEPTGRDLIFSLIKSPHDNAGDVQAGPGVAAHCIRPGACAHASGGHARRAAQSHRGRAGGIARRGENAPLRAVGAVYAV